MTPYEMQFMFSRELDQKRSKHGSSELADAKPFERMDVVGRLGKRMRTKIESLRRAGRQSSPQGSAF